MDFNFGFYSSLLLIFFFHGIVFSFLLLRKGIYNSDRSSRWLSLFVFLGAMYLAPFLFGYAGWYARDVLRDILFFVPFQQLLLIGPVLYYYTQSLLNESFRLTKRNVIHLFPAALYLIYTLVVFVVDVLILDEYYFYADGRDMDLDLWYQVLGLISMIVYLVLSLRYYNAYRKNILEELSYAESVLFRWIQRFLIAFIGILFLRILFFALNPEWGEFGRKFWYYLCFSILFYYIAIEGYANAVKSTVVLKGNRFVSGKDKTLDVETVTEVKAILETDVQISEINKRKAAIEKLMQTEELYRDPELTLTDLAVKLNVNSKQLSTIINQGFKVNFNDYINTYRVNAVKTKIDNNEHRSKTLLALALECGFNSKSTFNRAFKKYSGTTPRKYMEDSG